jgi:hypothetical protein
MILPSMFNEQQEKDFRFICSDFGGPTSTGYVLDVMYRALEHYKTRLYQHNPEVEINDEELLREVETCMAACSYYFATQVINGS